jgi:hypothetical protein
VIAEMVWPQQFKLDVQTGTFEQKLFGVLDEVRKLSGGMPPTFAFIDPFGATAVCSSTRAV